MADVLRDLLEQISQLETIFTVSPEKLRQITDHFVSELAKGLTKEGGDIPMNPTWILGWPTGKESGCYLALDMGGTNLRVVKVTLDGDRGFDVMQSKYHMPPTSRSASKRSCGSTLPNVWASSWPTIILRLLMPMSEDEMSTEPLRRASLETSLLLPTTSTFRVLLASTSTRFLSVSPFHIPALSPPSTEVYCSDGPRVSTLRESRARTWSPCWKLPSKERTFLFPSPP